MADVIRSVSTQYQATCVAAMRGTHCTKTTQRVLQTPCARRECVCVRRDSLMTGAVGLGVAVKEKSTALVRVNPRKANNNSFTV